MLAYLLTLELLHTSNLDLAVPQQRPDLLRLRMHRAQDPNVRQLLGESIRALSIWLATILSFIYVPAVATRLLPVRADDANLIVHRPVAAHVPQGVNVAPDLAGLCMSGRWRQSKAAVLLINDEVALTGNAPSGVIIRITETCVPSTLNQEGLFPSRVSTPCG